MLKIILKELKEHSPFTMLGAALGIIFMLSFKNISHETAHSVFYLLHPAHIFLSAIVTTSLYKKYTDDEPSSWKKFAKILAVGYSGSVLIGTLSDSLIPFWGEFLMDMPHREHHIAFIEHFWVINPLAILFIIFSYYKPITKFPHSGHVLLSTWASLFHMLMAAGSTTTPQYFTIFIFLFLAVWIPCCVSDIVFPLMFIKKNNSAR